MAELADLISLCAWADADERPEAADERWARAALLKVAGSARAEVA